jgi:hypothetical protein
VQLLDDGSVTDAPLAPRMIQIGIRVRPGMIVALDRGTTPPMIRWRFGTRPVEALAGDRLTILGREFRFVDARPGDERATPIRVGDTVVFRTRPASDELEIYDTVESGRPHHPEFLEAEFPRIEAIYQGTASA